MYLKRYNLRYLIPLSRLKPRESGPVCTQCLLWRCWSFNNPSQASSFPLPYPSHAQSESLVLGAYRDWFGDTGAPITPPKRRKPKGHKWERERAIRYADSHTRSGSQIHNSKNLSRQRLPSSYFTSLSVLSKCCMCTGHK